MVRQFRRLTALLLCLCLLSAGAGAYAPLATQAAAKTATITVGTVSAKAGEKVNIPVTISGNPGIAGMAMELKLPSKLKLQSVRAGEVLKSGMFRQNDTLISWYDAENVKKDGTLLTITVTAPKSAGTYKVRAALKDGEKSNLCNENSESVAVKFTAGAVKVGSASDRKTLKAPTLTGVKAKKGAITAKWKKVSGAGGYKIQLSTDKKFKKSVRTVVISKNTTVKYTAKNMKKGTYYVRVCSRKGDSTSDWSAVKKVKNS